MGKFLAYIDGGSRGNPGPAAAAFLLAAPDGTILQARGLFIGRATNNVAEYRSLIEALEAATILGARHLEIFSDSELLVRQIQGRYKVKSENIRDLFSRATCLLTRFKTWNIQHIGREKNKAADRLVNRALDAKHTVEDDLHATVPVPAASGPALRLGILLSGSGRTMDNINALITQGQLNAEVAVVISSRSAVAGVEKARKAGLDVKVIRKKDFPSIEKFSLEIKRALVEAKVDLIIQAGWLCLWHIPPRYENRVMNIHPALLPSFGGQGMWGHHVHEAVLAAGCKVSGCTVHFCTNEYDKGPIIVQRCCPVLPDDTPETLAARVFEQECIAYPEAIRMFAEGKAGG